MDRNKNIELLILRKLEGGLTTSEQNEFDSWRSSGSNELTFSQYQQVWAISNSLSDWEEFDAFSALENLRNKMPERRMNFYHSGVFQIAATVIFLVAIGTAYLFFNPTPVSITKYAAELNSRLFLADGSEIALAPGSFITTDNYFNQAERRVKLEGEAYFNVASQKNKPFIIELDGAEIIVVGTAFLANSNSNSVLVDHGRVILKDSKNPELQISLVAGEQAQLKSEKSSQVDFKVDWLNQKMELADRSVYELLKDLQLLFPNSLKVDYGQINADCRLTSKFNNISLLDVISELDLIFNLKFEQKPNSIRIITLNCE